MKRRLSIAILCAAALAAALGWLMLERPAHAGGREARTDALEYASPLEIAVSPDGARLYVLCQDARQVRVLDATTYKSVGAVQVGVAPRGMALAGAGDRLFVTNSWDDTLSVIDTKKLEVTATWQVRGEPSGVLLSKDGRHLFVASRVSNDIAVLNPETGEEEKRLMGGRGASYLTASPDGARIYATHIYPNRARELTLLGNRTAPQSEITVIDAARAVVVDRIPLHAIAGVFHVAFSADGRLGAVAEYHPKNLVPLAHLEHGGAFAHTLTLFGADVGAPVEVPLDELDRYAAQPFGVVFTPDKTRLFVTLGGSEAVLSIDVQKLLRFVKSHPRPQSNSFASDLSASGNYVVARIPVGHNPRGVALSKDGRRLFVANRLEDTISVIDARSSKVVSTIQLEGPKVESALRHGERTFYTAGYSFQGQIGCATCHIDSTFDGLTWDLEPDGFGRDIVDNRPIEDLRGTEPFKWNGGNPNIPTECGPRTELYFWRSEQYDNLTLADLSMYLLTLPARPNRWRSADMELTPAQERGRTLFARSTDKFGKPIAEENRCVYCHSGPKGTNQRSFDVGTRKTTDNTGKLDTPQLTNIALSSPYLHDGAARTLEEIWTIYNPEDRHGRTNDLTKDELNDLIEYLRTR